MPFIKKEMFERLLAVNNDCEKWGTKFQDLAATYERLGEKTKAACYAEAAEAFGEIFDPEIRGILGF